jgi:hypothetical protein
MFNNFSSEIDELEPEELKNKVIERATSPPKPKRPYKKKIKPNPVPSEYFTNQGKATESEITNEYYMTRPKSMQTMLNNFSSSEIDELEPDELRNKKIEQAIPAPKPKPVRPSKKIMQYVQSEMAESKQPSEYSINPKTSSEMTESKQPSESMDYYLKKQPSQYNGNSIVYMKNEPTELIELSSDEESFIPSKRQTYISLDTSDEDI